MKSKENACYTYLPYKTFLKMVKERTGIPEKYVRDIMRCLPEVLRQEISPGVLLRTPLGTFSYRVQKSKLKKLPTGVTTKVENKVMVVLKPSGRLRFLLSDEELDFFMKPQ